MAVFDAQVLQERRQRSFRDLHDNDLIVLVGAGHPIHKPGGLDQTYPFIPHPDYYWLTGSRRVGGILAFDPQDGWTHFEPPISAAEQLWEGATDPVDGRDVARFPQWLEDRTNRSVVVLGAAIEGVESDSERSAEVQSLLSKARRHKDSAEIDLIARAVSATAAGHAKAREVIRPGVSERQIQIEMEAEMFRRGADNTGYSTIVGTGTNSAVLHFMPSERVVEPNDMVLIDSGGAIAGYTADVTRTYPAGDRFTLQQQTLYDLVLEALRVSTAACQVGAEWHAVHHASAAVFAQGLRDWGILKGSVDELLENEAIALFFPHGVGHMVGLGVRDVGGRAPGREEPRKSCGVTVRVDLPLEEGFLMTVEPGLYFVPALLDNPTRREQYRDVVDWEALEVWRPLGGVRIEDNVLITAAGPEVLTSSIPK